MQVEILNEPGKKMSPKCKELALMAGGSHYPLVGGDTLEQFMRLTVEECIKVLIDNGYPNIYGNYVGVEEIKAHFALEKT